MTIEHEVAQRHVWEQRTANVLARTGGEVMHPNHYDAREAIRLSVLKAIDDACDEAGLPKMSDSELPALFRALDPIAERVFLKSVGL